MEENIYDLIIVGAGPAGLTAGIYASRRNLNNLIISKDAGGQAATAAHVENYPGFEQVNGFELMQKFQKQAEKFGSQFLYEEVENIVKKDNIFEVKTLSGQIKKAKALILAFGLNHRNLNVPGEKEFTGKGVAYCATCDGPLFKDKVVAVIGGGNAALESAQYLTAIAQKIYLIHRQEDFKAEEVLINKIETSPKIEIIAQSVVTKILGDKLVEKIEISNLQNQQKRELELSGVFIEIGYQVNAEVIKDLVRLNEKNEIIKDAECITSASGVFAAGDITDIKYKQIVISAGEGAKAALSAYQYLKGGEDSSSDWSA